MIQDIVLCLLTALITAGVFGSIVSLRLRRQKLRQQAEKQRLENEVTRLREREKMEELLRTKAENSFADRIKAMNDQFTALSEQITKQRADELLQTNKEAMGNIIAPLKNTIEKMEKSLRDTGEQGANRIGTLQGQIETLVKHTTEIGSKADNLSDALRMRSKTQGNWGETVLETLLQSEGLERGIHYEVQKTLRDEQGKSLRPDFVVHLPDGRAVIIDSKVSLTAYADYHDARDDNERDRCRRQHRISVENHIKELGSKEYFKHLNAESDTPGFVVMFVPIPGALQLALQTNPSLYQEAAKSGVILSGSEGIIPILWIIKELWTQTKQEKNMQEIVQHAKNLLERFHSFIGVFEGIDQALDKAKEAYSSANTKLRGGQGMLKSAKKIEQAGIKLNGSKSLPEPEEDAMCGEDADASPAPLA